MLKKFLNDESKATIRDFLFWIFVYPFVIAFAVACVAFIFSFSSFNDVKITDWISSLSTLFGIIVAIIGFNNWKNEKKIDLERDIFRDLINFNKDIYIARLKYSNLNENKEQINEISDFINNQLNLSFNNIRSSIRFYLFFLEKEQNSARIDVRQLSEDKIDPLYNKLFELHEGLCDILKNKGYLSTKEFTEIKSKIISDLEDAHKSIDNALKTFENCSS